MNANCAHVIRIAAVAVLVTFLATSFTNAEIRYRITPLMEVGSTEPNNIGYEVNERSRVVGKLYMSGIGFFWERDLMTFLPGSATGINDDEQVVGTHNGRGYLWEDGVLSYLPETTGAADVNNAAQVAVNTGSSAGLWQNGLVTHTFGFGRKADATGINEGGDVVGCSTYSGEHPTYYHAFLWEDGTLTDLGLGNHSKAHGINDHRQVVGQADFNPFLWDNGISRTLATNGAALDINNHGEIVGYYKPQYQTRYRGVIWDSTGMHELRYMVEPESWSGFSEIISGYGINDKGHIVGHAVYGGRYVPYLLTPLSYEPQVYCISATALGTSFTPVGGAFDNGMLSIAHEADVVTETEIGQKTYELCDFLMNMSLFVDSSENGLASAVFRGGSILIRDRSDDNLLIADVVELRLEELPHVPGLLAGKGSFEVTGGSLEDAFGETSGRMVQISFALSPGDVDDFSARFDGLSNITLTPIPEPTTLVLVGMGLLAASALRRRRVRT